MPCAGCEDRVERIIVKLRFIGKPGGKLVKRAPGNKVQGKIYMGPATWPKSFPKIWELVEPLPELRVPEAVEGNSVFEGGVFIDEDMASGVSVVMPGYLKDIKGYNDRKLVLPSEVISTSPKYDDVSSTADFPSVEELESYTRKQLIEFVESQKADWKSGKYVSKSELYELAKGLLPE